MDTDRYVYPPMDDLLRRQNAGGQGGFDLNSPDGGDLSGGDSLHPRPGESDVGSGLELDRSLQRVAAHEAWLNEQSQLPVENWLQSHGGKQISLENFGVSSSAAEFTQADGDRSLVVVDSRSNHWEELSRDLSDNTDLLVLDEGLGGVDQVKEILSQNSVAKPYTKISLIASSDGDELSFGSQQLTIAELSDQISLIQQSGFNHFDTSISLFSASSQVTEAIAVRQLSEASNLEQQTRNLVEESIKSGAFASAVEASFSTSKHTLIESLAKDFVDGLKVPSFSWADFEVANYRVNGAYLTGQNTILISEEIRSNDTLLAKVLLEEIGHWFDDSVGVDDSIGDEGDLFSRYILDDACEPEESSNIHESGYLSIAGQIFAAEFDANAPTINFSSANSKVETDGLSLKLQFSESLTALADDSGGNVRAQFTLESNGSTVTPTAVSLGNGSGSNDLLTFTIPSSSKIAQNDIVTVSYASSGSNAIKDQHGTPVLLTNFSATEVTNSSVQDLTAPTFDVSNAATQVVAGGDIIELKFSEDLTALATTAEARGQFVVKVGGVTKTVNTAALKSGSASIIQLTMAEKIAGGVDVEVAYTQHGTPSNNVVDAGNNTVSLANFATTGIENNSTTDLAPPTFLATNAATAVAANGTSVALKFSENLSSISDSAELRDQFAIKVNGVERATTAASLSSDRRLMYRTRQRRLLLAVTSSS
ncbi:cell surface protein required for swimming motility [Synechococcus sp. A18-46.1]|nr:cell surface protein required for swimming motility [Synechococcus sp. A18-46.1]